MITTSTNNSANAGDININTDTNEITYNVKSVVIDNDKAGIGDVVFSNDNPTIDSYGVITSAVKVISGPTATSAGVTGFTTCLGVIFGFENGYAKIMAPVSTSKKWGENASNDLSSSATGGTILNSNLPDGLANDYIGGKTIRFRNGSLGTYSVMNVARVITTLASSTATSVTSGRLTPDSAYYGNNVALNAANFAADNIAVATYQTYENYIRGMLPVTNGKDNPFSSKRHIGYRNTKLLAYNENGKGSTSNLISDSLYYPAANYCYYYTPSTKSESSTHYGYYLPDMVDIRLMMEDNTHALVNKALTAISGTTQNSSSSCWSSLRNSTTNAWFYHSYGVSYDHYFYSSRVVRPVALLKL